jgi:signal transduction histidine kinase/ActR/RegA family two-component response regulator
MNVELTPFNQCLDGGGGHALGDASANPVAVWRLLARHKAAQNARQTLGDVYRRLHDENLEYAAVLEQGKPVGLCSLGMIGHLMGSQFGHSVYSKKLIRDHLLERALILANTTAIDKGLELALSRLEPDFYQDVILVDHAGVYIGLIPARELVGLQSRLLSQKTLHLEDVLEQLRRSQEQVIQQERLSALGQMAVGIAHDFNNALTPIVAYSELMLTRPACMEDKTRARRYLEMIKMAGTDAAGIVSRMRDFYRTRSPAEEMRMLDLNAVVSEVIGLTQPRWKDQAMMHGINISVKPELGVVPGIMGNPSDLRDMLTNLIFNAVDAMPKGGTLSLRTKLEPPFVLAEVEDTGVGMTDEVRRRCFEPFFTAKGPHGTGLGLAMVFGAVQRHGGKIELRSELGRGACFTVRLPACAATETAQINVVVQKQVSPLHVLVVDDEPVIRDVVMDLLMTDEHTVETAAGGQEGLEKFKAGRFDLVLTDRCMPGMSGDQFVSELKLAAPAMPVIMVTGFGEFMNARGEHPAGVSEILSKPVKIAELRRAIAKALGPSTSSAALFAVS